MELPGVVPLQCTITCGVFVRLLEPVLDQTNWSVAVMEDVFSQQQAVNLMRLANAEKVTLVEDVNVSLFAPLGPLGGVQLRKRPESLASSLLNRRIRHTETVQLTDHPLASHGASPQHRGREHGGSVPQRTLVLVEDLPNAPVTESVSMGSVSVTLTTSGTTAHKLSHASLLASVMPRVYHVSSPSLWRVLNTRSACPCHSIPSSQYVPSRPDPWKITMSGMTVLRLESVPENRLAR